MVILLAEITIREPFLSHFWERFTSQFLVTFIFNKKERNTATTKSTRTNQRTDNSII